jgi:fumarate hydratase subunit beta
MVWTTIRLYTPLSDIDIETIHSGDRILLNGTIFTARDEAHKRLVELIDAGKPLPIDLNGAIIYYVGPTPTPPGKPIGSAGPTTAKRMDAYAIKLLEHFKIKGMIGKGERSLEFRDACRKYKSIYCSATGGVGALLSKHITSSEIVAYEDLGTEAIHKFEIKDFPVIVVNDIFGRDYYEIGKKRYSMENSQAENSEMGPFDHRLDR